MNYLEMFIEISTKEEIAVMDKRAENKPYIGITGFMSREEVNSMLSEMPVTQDRLLMVGVLASSKTLAGIESRWPNRYPKINQIGNIFTNHPLALNLIHYNTREPSSLSKQLFKLAEIAGENLHGFQLNIAWPPVDEINAYRERYPKKKIVLQIGNKAFSEINGSPSSLASKVEYDYEKLIDYVLLDPSEGLGKPFDVRRIREYLLYLSIYSKDNSLKGYGAAGGLSARTLSLVEPLVSRFPNLCIDAEGLLRSKNDSLDLDKSKQYINRFLEIFGIDNF